MDTAWTVTLSLLAMVFVALYRYITHKQRHFERLGVPHLKPTFLFGSQLPVFLRQRSFIEHMRAMYNELPAAKYCGAYNCLGPMIILRDPELIKEITIKHFDHFTDHMSYLSDELDPLFSKNLFFLRGNKWRDYRAVLSATFTGSKMKNTFNLINQCAINLREFLHRETQGGGVAIDTKDLFARYTTDVIASFAFGITIDCMKHRDSEFFKLGKTATAFTFWQFMKMFLAGAFPKLARVFRIHVVDPRITDFFTNLIAENVETREKRGIARPDMLQLMIQARDDPKNGVKMDIAEMTAMAYGFFFGGFDTVSTAMSLVAHLLAHHPQVQEKLSREIDERYEALCDESTGYETLREFHYLEACVNEAMRMYPPNPAMDRLCTKAFELPPALPGQKPFVVEPGAILWIPYVGIHNDERYFDQPEEFRPERFLDSDGKLKIKATDSSTFTPFGSGPRICIAHRFAMLEVKLVIVHLLRLSRLLPSEKTPDPIRLSKRKLQLVPENGFWLKLKLRDEAMK